MALKPKALLAFLFPMIFASTGLASLEAFRDLRNLPYIPISSGQALACAMVMDYLGNDQLWFENVNALFEEEVETRTALNKVIGGPIEPGEPIQVRGYFKRWISENAFMLGVGSHEILVVGKKSLFSDPTLDPRDVTVVGVYYSDLNEFCKKGQGTARFIKAERVFSRVR